MAEGKKLVTVNVAIKREIGNDTITIAMSEYTEIGNEAFTAGRLSTAAAAAVVAYTDNVGATIPPAAGVRDSGLPESTTVRVNRLTVSRKDGKRYIKAHGGRFDKYGLTVYPEILQDAGIDASKIPDAGLTPKYKWEMVAEKQPDGKYKCVGLHTVVEANGNE